MARFPSSRPPAALARRSSRGWLAAGIATLALGLGLTAPAAHAFPDARAQREIDHLLAYVDASQCMFVRNGQKFDAHAAREHLATKLGFVRWRLSTADEFVKYLATESSVSHEPYHIVCGTRDRPAGAWLSEELSRFRAANTATAAH